MSATLPPTMMIDTANRMRSDTASALKRERRVVSLGLAGWLIRRYSKREIDAATLNARLGHLLVDLGDLPNLWDLVLYATRHDVGEELGWSNWILFEKENVGRAMFIDTDSHIWRAFMIAAIRRVARGEGPTRLAPSEAGRDAVSLDNSDFWGAFHELRDDPNQLWQPILGDVDRAAALETIAMAVRTATREQETIDVEQLIAASIDPSKVARVGSEILEGWSKNAVLRRLVSDAGAYAVKDGPPPPDSHFGLWRLDRKDIYVPDSRLYSDDWGEQFGRGLANGENAAVIKKILTAASSISNADADWKASLRAAVSVLQKRYSRTHVVVLLVNASLESWRLSSEPGFKPASHRDFLIGTFHDARVYELHIEDENRVALVTDIGAVGEWRQYSPNRKLDTEKEIAPGLTFGISEVTAQEAQGMLAQDAGLLARLGASTQDEGIRELRRSVSFRLMEAFEYEVRVPEASVKIPITTKQQ